MEEDGCPLPAKWQAKLSKYGFQADGNASTAGSALNEDGHATASDSGTRDQETDALESPEPRSSSSSSLLTDGGGVVGVVLRAVTVQNQHMSLVSPPTSVY